MGYWLRAHGWLLGVLAVAAFTMLFRLDAQPIQNWDEGIHGEVSFEMVEGGDWITPHYMGGTYFRKPPLKIWMSAALFRAFGVNTWALRIPSALAGIAMALLIAWWMWEWRRSRWEALFAGVIVATMRPVFFHAFRTGETDGMLTFFVVLALYAWWKATELPTPSRSPSHGEGEKKIISQPPARRGGMGGWLALCGAAIGLAVMTKSAAGLLPLPIIAVHALITGSGRRIRIRDVLFLILVIVAVTAPWHFAMTVRHGAVFWNDYIGWHVVKRITDALHNETASVWWYLPTFARRFTPYTYWFAPALLYSTLDVLRTLRQRGQTALDHSPFTILHSSFSTRTLLLTWLLVGFVIFTASQTKFDWYLLPIYPAVVMLTVPFLIAASAYVRGTLLAHHWPVVARIAPTSILVLVLGTGLAMTTHELVRRQPPSPFPAIAAAIRGTGGVLVSYGLNYQQSPAGYFILRSALRDDIRIRDGRTDTATSLDMLTTPGRPSFLLTKRNAELPQELRQVLGAPRTFGAYALWSQ